MAPQAYRQARFRRGPGFNDTSHLGAGLDLDLVPDLSGDGSSRSA